MSTRRYTEDHEWIASDGEDVATVGVSEFAQDQLGEVVFVELPEVGLQVAQGEELCVVESVKAAGEIKAPVSGTIIEINEALEDDPGLVNSDAEGEGWLFKIEPSNPSELDGLMAQDAYAEFTDA